MSYSHDIFHVIHDWQMQSKQFKEKKISFVEYLKNSLVPRHPCGTRGNLF